jgi:uncharacterized membrane protein (DUF4010 family)
MFPRIFVIVLVFSKSLLGKLWIPLLLPTIAGILITYLYSKKFKVRQNQQVEFKNPFVLKSALLFGLIFAVVIFVSKAAQVYFGNNGIYAAGVLAGLTSVDAIVLTLSRLSGLNENVAVSGIIMAAIANTIVKGIISIFLGTEPLRRYVVIGLGILAFITAAALALTAAAVK